MAEIQRENLSCSFSRVLYGCKLSILKHAEFANLAFVTDIQKVISEN